MRQDVLDSAFAELERRADYWAEAHPAPGTVEQPRSRRPLFAVAGAVAGVAALVVALVLAVGPRTARSGTELPGARASATPRTSAPPVESSSTVAGPGAGNPSASGGRRVDWTAGRLVARLHAALKGTATFTFAAPNGRAPYLTGLMTRTSSGAVGGFDVQVVTGQRGAVAGCEDPGQSRCTITRRAGGASVAVGVERHGSAILYLVDDVRADGTELVMHLANTRDPKRVTPVIATAPPLTASEIVAVLDSIGA